MYRPKFDPQSSFPGDFRWTWKEKSSWNNISPWIGYEWCVIYDLLVWLIPCTWESMQIYRFEWEYEQTQHYPSPVECMWLEPSNLELWREGLRVKSMNLVTEQGFRVYVVGSTSNLLYTAHDRVVCATTINSSRLTKFNKKMVTCII